MSPRPPPFVSQRFERGAAPGRGTQDTGTLLQNAYSLSQETTEGTMGDQLAARLLHGGSSYMPSITDYKPR